MDIETNTKSKTKAESLPNESDEQCENKTLHFSRYFNQVRYDVLPLLFTS